MLQIVEPARSKSAAILLLGIGTINGVDPMMIEWPERGMKSRTGLSRAEPPSNVPPFLSVLRPSRRSEGNHDSSALSAKPGCHRPRQPGFD
jgi:hypothetical protein